MAWRRTIASIVSALFNAAFVDICFAVTACPACYTFARIGFYSINASARVRARFRCAVIDIVCTVFAVVSLYASTAVRPYILNAAPIFTRTICALINVS